MEGGYESGSGRMIHENEGGYGLELVGGARDGFASGSGIGSEGKGSIQNVILSHLDVLKKLSKFYGNETIFLSLFLQQDVLPLDLMHHSLVAMETKLP